MSESSTIQRETETCTFTSEDLDLSEKDLKAFNISGWNCSRPADNGERCIWHADTVEKNQGALASEIGEGDLYGALVVDTNLSKLSFPDATGLIGADLTDADLREADLPDANLLGADLTDADLNNADLTDADLREADLPDADLHNADLTDAKLFDADLTDADLSFADLPGADLRVADLPGANLNEAYLTDADLRVADLTDANLLGADLTDADLREADLTNANLSEVDLSGITLSRSTHIDAPGERITTEIVDLISEEQQYDVIARANHELRTAYSANGLISRARSARVRERKARRREAFAKGEPLSRGTAAWLGSLFSKVFTGYGVQLRWVAGVMILLYLLSAGVYHFIGEMSVGQSLYYSVVTFTTSPPEPAPTGLVMRAVAGFETFAGTTAVVFLGYVLGTREQV